LVIAGRQSLDLRVNTYRLIWNAILSYFLINAMGMIGACWAMLISLVASVILQIYYLREVVRPSLSFAHVLKPGIAVLAMALGLKLTGAWPLLPQALLAAAVYGTVFLALKPFDVEDRRMLQCLGKQPAGEMI
jgi:O-antigen/teichoic acid export membrane protein